jgi:hypothetical protein
MLPQAQEIERLRTEILFYKQQAAVSIIEIGSRLILVKETIPHGEWGKWLEEKVEFSQWTANKFMRAANELSNCGTLNNLSNSKVFALLDLPPEEREPFIQSNPVDEMTTRELQAAKKAGLSYWDYVAKKWPEFVHKFVWPVKKAKVRGLR